MLKNTLILLSTCTILFGQSTMCYKENHTSPSTIETIKLDGGECKSEKSVTDMKKDGWTISNISMNAGNSGMNYMYVFSKGKAKASMMMGSFSKEELRAEMRALAKEEQVAIEKARVEEEAKKGESIYKNACTKCHGQNAELKAYGKGVALNTMSAKDIQRSLEDYALGEQKYGLGIIMAPYANALQHDEAKVVAEYIQTLK
jgi:cytochrome c553